MRVAVDSSMLVGLINPLDHWRARAMALHDALVSAGYELVYFDCVAAETVSVVARRLHEKNRSEEVNRMLDRLTIQVPTDTICWILPDVPQLYARALKLMRSSSGALNFNDALIALACRERDIPAIASFDADFDQVPWLHRLSLPEDVN
ncbi:MAG: type II toxin-antitoxin system VapC family toxin [Chloroflexi bacterium]|nr:type II toxin-antitoxin system VapC family toxin [Chloroflexota bacterium]MBU1661413.1 type II toxin-antitoxin system VapC family toxin [Chloroflexota bacterium]